jgi:hypothetical protein
MRQSVPFHRCAIVCAVPEPPESPNAVQAECAGQATANRKLP